MKRNAFIGVTVALALVLGPAGAALASTGATDPPPAATEPPAPPEVAPAPAPEVAPAPDAEPAPAPEQVPAPGPAPDPAPAPGPAPEPPAEPAPAPGPAQPEADAGTIEPAPDASDGQGDGSADALLRSTPGEGTHPTGGGHEPKLGWLTLVKTVVNDDGGTASASEWDLQVRIDGVWTTLRQGEDTIVPAGSYELREIGGPEWYEQTSLVCVSDGQGGYDKKGTPGDYPAVVKDGGKTTCTFTNDDEKRPMGELKLVKTVVNDDGGSASASQWILQALIEGVWTTLRQGEYSVVPAGSYEVREVGGPDGYDQTSLVCVSDGHGGHDEKGTPSDYPAVVKDGGKTTCTFTNDDRKQPKKGWLKLVKVVVNDDGGSAEPGDWDLQVLLDGVWTTVTQGEWLSLAPGTYEVRETGGPEGYEQVSLSCKAEKPHDDKAYAETFGEHQGDSSATVSHGKKTTCTFTNDDESTPPPPVVRKDAVGSTQLDPDTWEVQYLLTVDNSAAGAVERTYTLHDTLTSLPAGVTLDEATADAGTPATPAPDTASWTTVTPEGALLQDGETIAAGAVHGYLIDVTVTLAPLELGEPDPCEGAPGTGIGILNLGVLVVDGVESDDDACETITYTDLGIEKTHSELEGGTVDPGQMFSYFLTVTNHGLSEAVDGVVTDPIPEGLTVQDVIVPDGWVDESEGSQITVRIPSLSVGGVGTIEVVVTVDEPDPIDAPEIGPDDPEPLPPIAFIGDLVNEACVEIENDGNPDNDCDTTTTEVDEIIANVFARCVNDAPFLYYSVQTSPSLAGQPITFTWTPDVQTPAPDPAAIVLQLQSGDSGVLPWPGAAFAPNNVSIQWPGYRPLVESDYDPVTGELLVDPSLVYNGMVLDTTYPTYPWRFGTTITLSVNPTLTIDVSYPPATVNCAVPRSAALVIDKTASVSTTAPGASFTYGLAVRNVAVDSVAEPVVVTDIIPADIRVDRIVTDTTSFPRWNECAVTGRDAEGFGGTLECTLLGPLAMGASAPLISLGVTVAGDTTSRSIVNTGEVCWGPPTGDVAFQACNDDSVQVTLSGLAATGGTVPVFTLATGVGAILLGAMFVMYRVVRRQARRG
ncbi:DUF11 domain-containing protein [Microbacterium ulmi]|uniref:DUF11 domain-containing protein n=1 Tax=Microbacterium ulmi TaxID=179095 RepID=A0A7Y2PZE0_9MICO|nr:DUF11 domain-containing protein [Microbacterium ulmi]NII70113.1 putative repeat protein (TIGR01451 family) [Microbacterium ulmi]NNH04346.1 DUF11 domain-containing protein [Microbacterium ulmi]